VNGIIDLSKESPVHESSLTRQQIHGLYQKYGSAFINRDALINLYREMVASLEVVNILDSLFFFWASSIDMGANF
jgi:hypothetical protein